MAWLEASLRQNLANAGPTLSPAQRMLGLPVLTSSMIDVPPPPEQTARNAVFKVGKPGQKEFRPYGTATAALYDKSPMVGISGPAGTGKSRLFLEKIHMICEKYPGARALIARKTRESLSEAALYTFEEKVVPAGHYILDGARRSHRQKYTYKNGSEVIICGLDKPQKIMSTEFDIIYVQEAIECDEADLDMLSTRLRNGIVPYQQLIFDCNPDKPIHWIWQGAQSGDFPLHQSHHEDNPTLWEEAPTSIQAERISAFPFDLSQRPTPEYPLIAPDGRIGRYTLEGEAYLAKLDRLGGARYKRLRLGLWVSAEGGVYEDEWNSQIHIHDPLPHPPRKWRRIWSVDFGFVSPLVIQCWAIDGNNRMYLYRELYHTHLLVTDGARHMLQAAGWSYDESIGHTKIREDADQLPEAIVCDTDAEGVAQLEKALGIRCISAYKGIEDGIQAVKARLVIQSDKKPLLYMCRDATLNKDSSLKDQAKPQCTFEEVDGYVWDTTGSQKRGERPVGTDDHGMDATKYAVCYVDNIRDKFKAADVAQAAGALDDSPYLMMVAAIPSNRGGSHHHNHDHRNRGANNGLYDDNGGNGPSGEEWRKEREFQKHLESLGYSNNNRLHGKTSGDSSRRSSQTFGPRIPTRR